MASFGPIGVVPTPTNAPQMGCKRGIQSGDTEAKMPAAKRERVERCDDGSTTASVGCENDSSSSVGNQSDNDIAPKGSVGDDEANEAAVSIVNIMMSIANGTAQRASKSPPLSAPGALESGNKSGGSSVSGDDDDHDDDNSGDSSQVKKQRRREKNRASAQQSRQRKKYHLETLEVRVEELERDRAALSTRVEALSAENRRLRALGQVGATSGDMDAVASAIKADELAGISLLAQLAQAAQKLSALPV
mmetsp:Transcript_36076/g.30370  ORF Transcript_36076/g.30370 Transcript_36076/m.30370 type:complete len:248 (+) Transcript_36076:122-865(+)|eukprot:CAMPEP_0173122608 /NCGR_PEP_ID=MMETSP1102-20130122/54291_1 /TAXON_ID=49646 /ORGANISM="Geminigera sp., Strain Caron Lab Isolate" /LENGTH=247 /DNA_ID=CAMNT_0014030055 /DNA_START=205 /DNA_END=948 /DNA_ORIENTATION=+